MQLRQLRNGVLLVLAIAYAELSGVSLLATPPICEEVCTESTACEETCYENMMEFENGNDITCLDFGVYDEEAACCGDFLCDVSAGETAYCANDCGPLGPNYCNECSAIYQTGCNTGEVCTFDLCCLAEGQPPGPAPPPPACFIVACTKNTSCCPGEYCLIDDNWQSGTCYPVR